MRHGDERETLIRLSTTVHDVDRAHGVGWSAVDAVESSSSRRRDANGVTTCMRVASALFLVGTALCGAGAVVGRSREMTSTSSALGSSNGKGKGRCDLSPQVAGVAGAEGTCHAEFMRARKLYEKTDDADDVAFERAVYECMNVPTGSPVVVPTKGARKPFETKPNESYAWMFVHVPKAAGSFFIEALKQNKNHEDVALGRPTNTDFTPNPWKPLNSFQARHIPPMLRRVARNRADGSGIFSKEFMKSDYDAGRHMYFTGATSMGLCGTIDAPCAYITVLRDPMERMWSEYAYLCLEGSEGHLSWTAEEREKSSGEGCSLDPLEWYAQKRSTAAQLTGLLAPRGGHTACGAEAAKANLASACVRYVFQDAIEDGLKKIRERLPDLTNLGHDGGNHFGENFAVIQNHNGSKGKLTPRLEKRLAAYRADPKIVAGLRAMVAHDVGVYEFAKQNYEKHWSEPLGTC